MEGERNGACLNRGEGGEVAGFETFLGGQREREVGERGVAALGVLYTSQSWW